VEQEDQPIPNDPPFTAYIGNLSFQVTEDDIRGVFKDSNIKSIRLITDAETKRLKGYGYVEFEDRNSLVAALNRNGYTLSSRMLRVNVAEGAKSRPGRPSDAKFATNWRQREPADPSRPSVFQSRNEGQGAFGNRDRPDSFRSSGFQGRSEGQGAFGNRDRPNPFGANRRENKEPNPRDFKKDPEQASPAPVRPKANPFGQAAPRDELAIQARLEEQRKEREAEREKERLAALEKKKETEEFKKREFKKPISSVPTDVGSWRKPKDDAPKGAAKTAFTAFSRKQQPDQKDQKRKAPNSQPSSVASSKANLFDVLGGNY
jgi:translation initiation factor 4B